MSVKKLRPLLILLAVLVVFALIQKRQPNVTNLTNEAGLIPLLPGSLRVDNIQGVDLQQGSNSQDVVRLRRKGTAWYAANYFDAPVQMSKTNHLLRVLTRLQGELRSDKAKYLKSFQLESGQAHHLRIYTNAFDKPSIHLLIGKRQDNNGFVRVEDDARVYSVSLDLFNVLGLQADNVDKPPATKVWLELQIQNIPEHQITSFELRTPDRRWKFSRPLPVTSSTSHSSSIDNNQRQWVLSDPRVDFPLNQGYVDGLISTLRTLRADDISRTDKAEVLGLLNSAYEAVVTSRTNGDTEQMSIISVGHEHPKQKGKRYARRGREGPIYILPAWVFQRMFPQPKTFLQLPGLQFQPGDLRRITLFLPAATVQLERENAPSSKAIPPPTFSDWSLTSPSVDFRLRKGGIEEWVQNLSRFAPDNIAPDLFVTPSAQHASETRIDIVLDNGVPNVIRLGRLVDDSAQHYTLFLNDYSTPFVIDQKTRRKIFPPLKDLLALHLLNHSSADIMHLTWQTGALVWRLERFVSESTSGQGAQSSEWKFVRGQKGDIDQQKVESVLNRISFLLADDWVETEEQSWPQTKPALILLLGLREDRDVRLTFTKKGESIAAKHSDIPGLFILSGVKYNALHQDLVTLSRAEASFPASQHIEHGSDRDKQHSP